MSLMSGVLERKFVFEPGDLRVRVPAVGNPAKLIGVRVSAAGSPMTRSGVRVQAAGVRVPAGTNPAKLIDIGQNKNAAVMTREGTVLQIETSPWEMHADDQSRDYWSRRSMNWFLARLPSVWTRTLNFSRYVQNANQKDTVFFVHADKSLMEASCALSLSHDFLQSDRYDKLLVFLDSVLETM